MQVGGMRLLGETGREDEGENDSLMGARARAGS